MTKVKGSSSSSSSSSRRPPQHHVVIFPFMAHGHAIPLIDLSKALSRRGLTVTIITTPSYASSVHPHLRRSPNVHLKTIPFPDGSDEVSGARSPDQVMAFFNATKLLAGPFESAMRSLITGDAPPACVVSDSFLGWTNAVCRSLGVPRVVFNGMGVFATLVKKSLAMHKGHEGLRDDTDRVEVNGVDLPFDLTRADLPLSLRDTGTEISDFFLEAESSDMGSWAVIANSFAELESPYIPHLEELFKNGTRAFCVGPLFLYDLVDGRDGGDVEPSPSEEWDSWLDRREKTQSVIYVSFGSQSALRDDQLDELAHGLEMSGEDYIWIVRSESWRNPTDGVGGLVVRSWVDQKRVLAHRAVGGFLSHCGWNSTLESLANGVPVLAWPMHAEQHLNAKYLVEGLRAGIGLEGGSARDGRVVGRAEISEGVRELMSGVRGRQARESAVGFEKVAKRAVQVGGSSYNCLNEFIDKLN